MSTFKCILTSDFRYYSKIGMRMEQQLLRSLQTEYNINEDLTKLRMDWAKRARKLKVDGKALETWTRDGIIFVKISEKRIERVDNEQKLCDLEQTLPVLPPRQQNVD